jgi:hypothetical protein
VEGIELGAGEGVVASVAIGAAATATLVGATATIGGSAARTVGAGLGFPGGKPGVGVIRVSSGSDPPEVTTNVKADPIGTAVGSSAVKVKFPVVSWLSPSGVFPTTTASSHCPGTNAS